MGRPPEVSGKRYIINKPTGLIRAFREGNITEKQLRGHLKRYTDVNDDIPIEVVIKAAEAVIEKIRNQK